MTAMGPGRGARERERAVAPTRFSSVNTLARHATRVGLAFTILLLAGIAVFAQPAQWQSSDEEAVVKDVVDRIMHPYLDQNDIPGAIVGVSLHGRRYFFSFGQATDAGAPFTADTLVEIGSCTKTFTTTLFALAVKRNQIDPNASIQTYMPPGYRLQPEARPLTPLELADFTSGLPDDPPNVPRRQDMRSIEHYTTHDFLMWISNWRPATRLPAPYRYSNAGIGLLGYLIVTATGTSWDNQLNDEILQPLTMHDTTLRPSREQMERMAQGHRQDGNDAPRWPIYAWYAAGGLRSTARDMLSFGEANLGHKDVNGKPISNELIAAMQLAQKPIYVLPNGINEQALAWVNNMGNGNPNLHPVILKNGGTAGFGTVIVINPSKDLALFIAVNQNGSNPADKGIEIVRHIRFQ
jgi:CubicO group peptidase (beta-lactamase class C family)